VSPLPKWFFLVDTFAPLILALTPLAPIASAVAKGIQEAEALIGATSEQKLAHAVNIARAGIEALNAQLGRVVVDPAIGTSLVSKCISVIVTVTNLVHQATAPSTP